jgi:hypothetical protein
VSFTTTSFIPTGKGGIPMQYVSRYHLRPGKEREARLFTLEKEKEGIPTAPGWKYLGTYYNSMQIGRFDIEIRHEIENYAAIDAWRGDPDSPWVGDPDSPWVKNYMEFAQFLDLSRPIETAILLEASEYMFL